MSLRTKQFTPSQTPERTLTLKEIKFWHKALAALVGSLVTYGLWRLIYQSQMALPYPEELSLLLEVLWGVLIGLGPFFGLAVLQTAFGLLRQIGDKGQQDMVPEKQLRVASIQDSWMRALLGALGGLAGGIAWWLTAKWSIPDSRTLTMTSLWAIVYTNAILLPPLIVRHPRKARVFIIPALALLPLVGFLITKWIHIAPDQADVDMSVGLWLRVSLIAGAILIVPTAERSKKPKHHATGEQISLLMQTMMEKNRWLTKGGMLMHMAEELSYSPATVRKLCSGERRPSAEAARKLLQLGKEAGLDRAWGNDLLEATHHFSDQQIAGELDSVFRTPPVRRFASKDH